MNNKKIKNLEEKFFETYPEGFNDPEMIKVSKKHNLEKIHDFAISAFSKENFDNIDILMDNIKKLVSRSSMVSVFEKAKFKDAILSFSNEEKKLFSNGLYKLIYEKEEEGFNTILNILENYKLAKWPLITVFKTYINLEKDLLVKPTTTKSILNYFEVKDIKYNSKPSYEFYSKYRDFINNLKKEVTPSLAPNNPAFLGFLMLTIPKK
jgi:hypothetical protein